MSRWTMLNLVGVLQTVRGLDDQTGDRAVERRVGFLERNVESAWDSGEAVSSRSGCSGRRKRFIDDHFREVRRTRSALASLPGLRNSDLLEHPGERLSVDELHGVEVDAPFAADRINRHDVRMVQRAAAWASLRKRCKSLASNMAAKRQNFQRDAPAQGKLHGLVNDSHAAPADLAYDLKIAERVRRQILAWIGRRSPRFARRPVLHPGSVVDQFQSVEATSQVVRNVRVAVKEFVSKWEMPCFQQTEVFLDCFHQPRIVRNLVRLVPLHLRRIGADFLWS